MTQDRYYQKKDYKGDFSAFGAAIAFTIVGVFSLIFRAYNIDFIGLAWWGYWLFIPAFFSFVGGFSSLYWDKRMRDSVYAAGLNREGRVKVEDLAQEVGYKPKNMLRILVDLRTKRGLQYSYDSDSGEIIFGEEIKYEQAAQFTEPMSKKQAEVIFPAGEIRYCHYCGHKPPAGSKFCESCGSNLE